MRALAPAVSVLLIACPGPPDALVLDVPDEHRALFEAFLAPIDSALVTLDSPGGRTSTVRVVADLPCAECFSIQADGDGWLVRGDAPLGIQYGVAELLERAGFGFFHPFATRVPADLSALAALADADDLGVERTPAVPRRGLHLHTLHPIEGMFDFWMGGPVGEERARQVIDWVVKNRGDYLQWVGLDDISGSSFARQAWREHTAAVVEHAHFRGLETGLGVQLFGTSNLQLAFDLVDSSTDPVTDRTRMDERFGQIAGLGFDSVNLSFGEFFGEDPEVFVASVESAWDAMNAAMPDAEMTTVIHVGNFEDLRVEYRGEEVLYYFLSAFADRPITPWIHTVMYYNLFEDAGGAYRHDEFDEHRAFLTEALLADEPVGYFPESAYWVAFDVNVPTMLPLYVRSRWLDLDRIRDIADGALRDHVLFSSGWEWGFWLHDRVTLRMGFETPATWQEALHESWAPLGEAGAAVADLQITWTEAQADTLIDRRAAAFLGGRDSVIDFGDSSQGIVSQPDRPRLDEVADLDDDALIDLGGKLDALADLADASGAAHREAITIGVEHADVAGFAPWIDEIVEGSRVTELRARYVGALYDAAIADRSGSPASVPALIEEAESILEEARDLIRARHAAAHAPHGRILFEPGENPTLYDYGYLAHAEDLCFWERERVRARNVVFSEDGAVPGCTLDPRVR